MLAWSVYFPLTVTLSVSEKEHFLSMEDLKTELETLSDPSSALDKVSKLIAQYNKDIDSVFIQEELPSYIQILLNKRSSLCNRVNHILQQTIHLICNHLN